MATSSSTDYNLTARAVITQALQKINVVGLSQEPTADMAEDARQELNRMLHSWQKYGLLWQKSEGSLTLTSATQSYTLTTARRVLSARFKNTDGNELPMIEMEREAYFDLPRKDSTGIPTQFYFDPQRATGTLYVWPVLATATTQTIEYTHQRRFEDIDSLNNDLDVTQEALDVVVHNLAARLADSRGRSGDHINRIIARAGALLQEMKDDSRPASYRFAPDTRYG